MTTLQDDAIRSPEPKSLAAEDRSCSTLINRIGLLLLLSAWMLSGVIGRDPWKADEAYTFGLVLDIMETGDYVVPTLAGEPFMQKPPLFFCTAALFGRALSPLIGFPSAARMANVFYLSLTLLFLTLAARELLGPGKGWLAAVVFTGFASQLLRAQFLITDVSLVTGFAIALYGLALVLRRPWWGGFWTGTGIGVTFMSKGLLGPGLIGITMLLLPVLCKTWRTKGYFVSFIAAGLASLPWLLIWPLALYARSPVLFNEWFLDNNLGRFLGAAKLGLSNKIGMTDARYNFVLAMPMLLFPAFLVIAWAFLKNKRAAVARPAVQLPLLMLSVIAILLSLSRNARSLYGLPMLAPAAVLGAWSVESLTPKFSRLLHRFIFPAYGVVLALLWLGWLFQVGQFPSFVWDRLHAQFPEFRPTIVVPAVLVALAWTVGSVLWMIRQKKDEPNNVSINWSVFLTGTFLLLMTLWLPLLESNMSYRHLTSVRAALPAAGSCVASLGLGEPQRAMFHVYGGLKTIRLEEHKEANCDWILLQSDLRDKVQPEPPGGPWELVWQNVHSRKESFRLFRKK